MKLLMLSSFFEFKFLLLITLWTWFCEVLRFCHVCVKYKEAVEKLSDPVKTYFTDITQLEALSETESLAHSH